MRLAFILSLLLAARSGSSASLPVHNRLIFTRDSASKGATKHFVWLVNSDGSGARRIWQVPPGYGRFGGFSYDGKRAISYNQFNLYVHDLNSGKLRRLLLWSGGWSPEISDTAFSPDGKHIVCTVSSASTGDNEAAVLVLDTKQTYSVLDDSNSVMRAQVRPANADTKKFPYFQDVSLSSDGRHLITTGGIWHLSHFDGSNLEVWTMNLDGSSGRQLTNNRFWETQPAWNNETGKIAFTKLYSGSGSDYANDRGSDLFVMSMDGTHEERLTQNRREPEAGEQIFRTVSKPQFSPDGTRIAYNLTNSGNASPNLSAAERSLFYQDWIYSIDEDGQNEKRLCQGTLVQWIP